MTFANACGSAGTSRASVAASDRARARLPGRGKESRGEKSNLQRIAVSQGFFRGGICRGHPAPKQLGMRRGRELCSRAVGVHGSHVRCRRRLEDFHGVARWPFIDGGIGQAGRGA